MVLYRTVIDCKIEKKNKTTENMIYLPIQYLAHKRNRKLYVFS